MDYKSWHLQCGAYGDIVMDKLVFIVATATQYGGGSLEDTHSARTVFITSICYLLPYEMYNTRPFLLKPSEFFLNGYQETARNPYATLYLWQRGYTNIVPATLALASNPSVPD